MKKQFYVSSNQEQYEVVNYNGIYKEYIVIKNASCGRKSNNLKLVDTSTDIEEVERISKSRIRQKIKELALCNDFEYFFTQTLKDNRYDLENFKKNIQAKFKAYKRKNKDFIFLIIYEKHKDGAFHLHGLVGGLGNDLHINDNGYYSLSFFEELGYNSLSAIKDKLKVSHYITKYLSKDPVKTDSNVSYFHSRGLKFAKRFYIDDLDTSFLKKSFENDYIVKFKE